MVEISERPTSDATKTVATAAAERALVSEVAASIVEQVRSLVATEKWPLQSAENTLRGVDFYPRNDFMRALVQNAVNFKLTNGYVPCLASPTSFNEHGDHPCRFGTRYEHDNG
jgi:hypothetical protein